MNLLLVVVVSAMGCLSQAADLAWDTSEWQPILAPCPTCHPEKKPEGRTVAQNPRGSLRTISEGPLFTVGGSVTKLRSQDSSAGPRTPVRGDSNIVTSSFPSTSTSVIQKASLISVNPNRLRRGNPTLTSDHSVKSQPDSSSSGVHLIYLPEGSLEQLTSANAARIIPASTPRQQHSSFVVSSPQLPELVQNVAFSDKQKRDHSGQIVGGGVSNALPVSILTTPGQEQDAKEKLRLLEAALTAPGEKAPEEDGRLPRVFIAPSNVPPPPGYIKIPLVPHGEPGVPNVPVKDGALPQTFLTSDKASPPPGFIKFDLPEDVSNLSRDIPVVAPNNFSPGSSSGFTHALDVLGINRQPRTSKSQSPAIQTIQRESPKLSPNLPRRRPEQQDVPQRPSPPPPNQGPDFLQFNHLRPSQDARTSSQPFLDPPQSPQGFPQPLEPLRPGQSLPRPGRPLRLDVSSGAGKPSFTIDQSQRQPDQPLSPHNQPFSPTDRPLRPKEPTPQANQLVPQDEQPTESEKPFHQSGRPISQIGHRIPEIDQSFPPVPQFDFSPSRPRPPFPQSGEHSSQPGQPSPQSNPQPGQLIPQPGKPFPKPGQTFTQSGQPFPQPRQPPPPSNQPFRSPNLLAPQTSRPIEDPSTHRLPQPNNLISRPGEPFTQPGQPSGQSSKSLPKAGEQFPQPGKQFPQSGQPFPQPSGQPGRPFKQPEQPRRPLPQPSQPFPRPGQPSEQPRQPPPQAGQPFPQPGQLIRPPPQAGQPFPQPGQPRPPPQAGQPFPQPGQPRKPPPQAGQPFPQPGQPRKPPPQAGQPFPQPGQPIRLLPQAGQPFPHPGQPIRPPPQAGQPFPQPGQSNQFPPPPSKSLPQPGQPFPQPGQPSGQPSNPAPSSSQSFPRPGQPFPQPGQPPQPFNQPFSQPGRPISQPVQSFLQPGRPFPQSGRPFPHSEQSNQFPPPPSKPFTQPGQPFPQPGQPSETSPQPGQPFIHLGHPSPQPSKPASPPGHSSLQPGHPAPPPSQSGPPFPQSGLPVSHFSLQPLPTSPSPPTTSPLNLGSSPTPEPRLPSTFQDTPRPILTSPSTPRPRFTSHSTQILGSTLQPPTSPRFTSQSIQKHSPTPRPTPGPIFTHSQSSTFEPPTSPRLSSQSTQRQSSTAQPTPRSNIISQSTKKSSSVFQSSQGTTFISPSSSQTTTLPPRGNPKLSFTPHFTPRPRLPPNPFTIQIEQSSFEPSLIPQSSPSTTPSPTFPPNTGPPTSASQTPVISIPGAVSQSLPNSASPFLPGSFSVTPRPQPVSTVESSEPRAPTESPFLSSTLRPQPVSFTGFPRPILSSTPKPQPVSFPPRPLNLPTFAPFGINKRPSSREPESGKRQRQRPDPRIPSFRKPQKPLSPDFAPFRPPTLTSIHVEEQTLPFQPEVTTEGFLSTDSSTRPATTTTTTTPTTTTPRVTTFKPRFNFSVANRRPFLRRKQRPGSALNKEDEGSAKKDTDTTFKKEGGDKKTETVTLFPPFSVARTLNPLRARKEDSGGKASGGVPVPSPGIFGRRLKPRTRRPLTRFRTRDPVTPSEIRTRDPVTPSEIRTRDPVTPSEIRTRDPVTPSEVIEEVTPVTVATTKVRAQNRNRGRTLTGLRGRELPEWVKARRRNRARARSRGTEAPRETKKEQVEDTPLDIIENNGFNAAESTVVSFSRPPENKVAEPLSPHEALKHLSEDSTDAANEGIAELLDAASKAVSGHVSKANENSRTDTTDEPDIAREHTANFKEKPISHGSANEELQTDAEYTDGALVVAEPEAEPEPEPEPEGETFDDADVTQPELQHPPQRVTRLLRL